MGVVGALLLRVGCRGRARSKQVFCTAAAAENQPPVKEELGLGRGGPSRAQLGPRRHSQPCLARSQDPPSGAWREFCALPEPPGVTG